MIQRVWAETLRCRKAEMENDFLRRVTAALLDHALIWVRLMSKSGDVCRVFVGKLYHIETGNPSDAVVSVSPVPETSGVASGVSGALLDFRAIQRVHFLPRLALVPDQSPCGVGMLEMSTPIQVSDLFSIDHDALGIRNICDMFEVCMIMKNARTGEIDASYVSIPEFHRHACKAFGAVLEARSPAGALALVISPCFALGDFGVAGMGLRNNVLETMISSLSAYEGLASRTPMLQPIDVAFRQYVDDDDPTLTPIPCNKWPCFSCMLISAASVARGVVLSGVQLFYAFQSNDSRLRMQVDVHNPTEILVYGRSPLVAKHMKSFFFGCRKTHNPLRSAPSSCFGLCADECPLSPADSETIDAQIVHNAYPFPPFVGGLVSALESASCIADHLSGGGKTEEECEQKALERVRGAPNSVTALAYARSYAVACYLRWCAAFVRKTIFGEKEASASSALGLFSIDNVSATTPCNRRNERAPEVKISSTRPKVAKVVRSALYPTCPACSAPYMKSNGCMHMHCPACGNHFCHACNRRHVGTYQPGTHEEFVAALLAAQQASKTSTIREVASNLLATFALSQENTINLLRIQAREDFASVGAAWPPQLRLSESSRKRTDHCLANSKFVACPTYPENFMKRSDGILDHHNTIFSSRFSLLHEAVGGHYAVDERDATAMIAGVDLLIRVTKMLHVAGVEPKKLVRQGTALAGKAASSGQWDDKQFFHLVVQTDGALEALAKTVEFYGLMERRAVAQST